MFSHCVKTLFRLLLVEGVAFFTGRWVLLSLSPSPTTSLYFFFQGRLLSSSGKPALICTTNFLALLLLDSCSPVWSGLLTTQAVSMLNATPSPFPQREFAVLPSFNPHLLGKLDLLRLPLLKPSPFLDSDANMSYNDFCVCIFTLCLTAERSSGGSILQCNK